MLAGVAGPGPEPGIGTGPDDRDASTAPADGRPALRYARSYLPALTAAVLAVGILRVYGTPVPVSGTYLVYLVLAVALPGTLVWRRVRGPQVSFTEDVAMGSAIGLAAQAVFAFALAPVGLSRWSWVWVPAVVLLSALRPRWRRCWSRPRPSSGGLVDAWVQAGAVTAAGAWLGATAMANNPITYIDGQGPWSRGVPSIAYVDMPFHQAIAAGIDQHFPLVYPYLYDEPLRYHLFVYEHLAGAASATGIDLTWLVYRLHTIPLVALAVVLAGVLARRLSGLARSAPLAAVIVTLSASVPVYGWIAYPFQNPGFLHFATYRSPTQVFGLPVFLATLTVVVMLLRERLGGRLALVGVFTLLGLAAGGSKSTFLPVLVCGLLLALATSALRRSQDVRPAAALTGITVGLFGVVFLVLLGGHSGTLAISPLSLVDSFALTQTIGDPYVTHHQVVMLGLGLVSWLCAGGGGLLLWRRFAGDPAGWMVVGVGVAAVSAALLTTANGLSQLYFLYAGWPVLGILSAWGLTAATERSPRRGGWLVWGSLVLGVAALRLVTAIDGTDAPPRVVPALPYWALALPWLGLAALVVALAGIAVLARLPRVTALSRTTVVAVVITGLVAGSALSLRAGEVVTAVQSVVTRSPGSPDGWPVPRDGAVAALYVRDHSEPDDVVATNAHCYGPPEACDARHFWVSALTERRVLVEGWAYPEGFRPGQTRTSPFWDTERYDQNEAVFDDPSQEAVEALADRYGVRWLLVDRTLSVESDDLRRFARLVHESDDAAVYELP